MRRDEERAERGELDLSRLDLLAEPLGRAPDHQAGHEDRHQDVEEHPVEAAADAAEHHLAEEQVDERHGAAGRRLSVEAAVDRAVRGVGGRDRPERRVGQAEADLLVGHVAARGAVALRDVHARVAQHLRAVLLGREVDGDADREDREHRGEHHPAVPAGRDHLPEHEDLPRRDQQDREHLEEVRQAVRVLERDRPSSRCSSRHRSSRAASSRSARRPGRARSSAGRPGASSPSRARAASAARPAR